MSNDLIKHIHEYLREDIQKMSNALASGLEVKEELIGLVARYLIEAGGKRIRPILTILSSKMFGYEGDNAVKLAAAIEFIHIATLLHDDVVDGSSLRRFKPTANMVWGNNASILVGDFLFSQSFKLMVEVESMEALKVLSSASATIIEGEVSQLAKLQQKRIINIDEYYEVINAKTAVLFSAACEVGAILTEQPQTVRDGLRLFGLNLGVIFQIIDDWLDYFGQEKEIGKAVGSDFFEGKTTIPLILLCDRLPAREQEKLLFLMRADQRTEEDFAFVKDLLERDPTIKEEIAKLLETLRQVAKLELIQVSPDNECRRYLIAMLDFAMQRSY